MNINDYSIKSCTGCGICEISCPVNAVSINMENGFFHSIVDNEKCIDCGQCKQFCTRYNEISGDDFLLSGQIKAAKARKSAYCRESSSGAIAYLLSRLAIEKGYIICGVTYDMERRIAKHIIVSNMEEIEKIRGTKYLQSYTADALKFVKNNPEKKIMIIGTPCQIRPIRLWADNQNRENLFLVDLFCQGVPSYLVFEKYLEYLASNYGLKGSLFVKFRDKTLYKWHDCQMTVKDEEGNIYSKDGGADMFSRFFNSSLCFNDSCYECIWKTKYSYSDIRLGDFWCERFRNDDEGISIVICQTEKGKKFFEEISGDINNFAIEYKDFEVAIQGLINRKTDKVDKMKNMINKGIDLETVYKKLIRMPYLERIKRKGRNLYHRIFY